MSNNRHNMGKQNTTGTHIFTQENSAAEKRNIKQTNAKSNNKNTK